MSPDDILGRITDTCYGVAFAAFTEDYLRYDPADRLQYETIFGARFGQHYLEDWRGWRRRHGHP